MYFHAVLSKTNNRELKASIIHTNPVKTGLKGLINIAL
jgi:hypothetical protein